MKPLPLFLFAGLLAAGTLLQAAGPNPSAPNVVLVLIDDFGFECIGANGGESYATPHLDRLAASGMRFENCHVQPLCTPTRVQLMTGLYNVRNYIDFGKIDPHARTFAHLFAEAGYATGIVGKWQLGDTERLPQILGFQDYCLWQYTRRPSRYRNPGLEVNGEEKDYTQNEYGPDVMHDYALDFIKRNRERPFLLYYPMVLTHAPFEPTPDDKAYGQTEVRGDKRNFASMVAYTDKLVGTLIDTLEALHLRERTLVIVLGDNGTQASIVSQFRGQPYIGGKGQSLQTATHVPMIANWPGKIPAGRVNPGLVDSTDIFPTLCEAAAISLQREPPLDGQSVWAQLQGRAGRPREWSYCWFARDGGPRAQQEFARDVRFKLYADGRLFDLAHDTQETNPLSAETTSGDAAAARLKLQAALSQYRTARPPRLMILHEKKAEAD